MIIQGALLILVAIVHLVMTPEIGQIVAHNTTPRAYAFLWPPYMLDHVAVGILLFPLGISTLLCASGVARGDALVRRIACVNALAVLALPIAVVVAVPVETVLSAPPFLGATAILILTTHACSRVLHCTLKRNFGCGSRRAPQWSRRSLPARPAASGR